MKQDATVQWNKTQPQQVEAKMHHLGFLIRKNNAVESTSMNPEDVPKT